MGFALIGFGLLLTIAGARNTQGTLFQLLQGDFTGAGSFLYWIAAIGVIGAIGYIKGLAPISHAFLALIFVVFVLAENKSGHDLFAELNSALATPSGGGSSVDNSFANAVSGISGTATNIFQSFGQ